MSTSTSPRVPVTDPRVRAAEPRDRDAVIAIRDEAIRSSTALWIDEVPTREVARAWFDQQVRGGTVLVAVHDGAVVGFAAFGPLRPYSGYRFTAEDSVYLVDAAQGQGLGRALLEALVVRAAENGEHSLIGMIEASNSASLALHARCGFTEVGRVPQAGLKFGRWLDLVIVQRLLGADDAPGR